MNRKSAVLVTGAESGIGLATARLLADSGYEVFAGVHRSSPALAGIHQIVMDVTDPESLRTAEAEIRRTVGEHGLFALVNNAGIGDILPLEFTPMERFRGVFDVNVFGVLSVTQTFLPLIRTGRGRIVNIGSIGGLLTIPFGGALAASKHAVEAISDALRLELADSGIPVTCLQPASINSGAAEKLSDALEATIAALPDVGRQRYADSMRAFGRTMMRAESHGSPPDVVACAVADILSARLPPAREIVGKDGWLLNLVAKHLPDSIRDRIMRRLFLRCPDSSPERTGAP